MERPMPVKFVVFSQARSGTSLLVETLNNHHDVYCHGEIFHEVTEWHIRKEYIEAFGLPDRQSSQVEFCYSVLSFTNWRSAVGFKMWLDQAPSAGLVLLKDKDIKKIILNRENRLAQFSSAMLAKKTGVWNITTHKDDKFRTVSNPPTLEFSATAFKKFVEYQDRLFDTYENASSGEILALKYVDVARLEFSRIYDFLEVEFVAPEPAKQKLYSSDILNRFHPSHKNEILDVLAVIGKPEWVLEKID
jgi:LPS sulfotransferase NodH